MYLPVSAMIKYLTKSLSFDLDLPLECDDEFWEPDDHGSAFKQPPDRPSTITYFNCFLRLQQILGSAMRTIVRRSALFCQSSV